MSYATTLPRPDTERILYTCYSCDGRGRETTLCKVCANAGRLAACTSCGAVYPYHGVYTPIVCSECDDEAGLYEPLPKSHDRPSSDEED